MVMVFGSVPVPPPVPLVVPEVLEPDLLQLIAKKTIVIAVNTNADKLVAAITTERFLLLLCVFFISLDFIVINSPVKLNRYRRPGKINPTRKGYYTTEQVLSITRLEAAIAQAPSPVIAVSSLYFQRSFSA
jgi:hypothetical protein